MEAIDSDKEGEDLITSSLQKLANLRKINAELFDTPAPHRGIKGGFKPYKSLGNKEDDIVEQMVSDVEDEKEEIEQH